MDRAPALRAAETLQHMKQGTSDTESDATVDLTNEQHSSAGPTDSLSASKTTFVNPALVDAQLPRDQYCFEGFESTQLTKAQEDMFCKINELKLEPRSIFCENAQVKYEDLHKALERCRNAAHHATKCKQDVDTAKDKHETARKAAESEILSSARMEGTIPNEQCDQG